MSNVRRVKKIELIEIESVVGKGEQDDPVRGLFEYFSMDGCLLASRDTWKVEDIDNSSRDVLSLSYPLTEYVSMLNRDGKIFVQEGENIWSATMRCWKDDREKLEKYAGVIRLLDELPHWKIDTQWHRILNKRCARCGNDETVNIDGICFPCWEKLSHAAALLNA